jgi:hypothetical protein
VQWSSDALYGGRVNAAPSVAAHTLADLPTVTVPADGTITVSAGTLSAARTAASENISDRIAEAEEAVRESKEADTLASKSGSRRTGSASVAAPSDKTLDAVRDLLLPSATDITLEAEALLSPMLLIDTAGAYQAFGSSVWCSFSTNSSEQVLVHFARPCRLSGYGGAQRQRRVSVRA